jgi:UDP-N-acetylglucosamine transferase subunit ALG13
LIFVTIGSMFPFDRLVRAMDAWAAARPDPDEEVLAQIGDGGHAPAHMRWVRRLDRADYDATVARARLVVAHAGVGSVVTAGEFGKPVVVLPRRQHLAEHTSDHQMETARWLRGKPGVHVAETEADLPAAVAAALARPDDVTRLDPVADPAFIARLRDFILR